MNYSDEQLESAIGGIEKGFRGKKAEPKRISFFKFPDGRIAEQVYERGNGQGMMFAIFNPQTNEVTYEPKLTIDGADVYPENSELIEKGVVLLPSKATDYGDITSLVDKIRLIIHKYVDVKPFWEKLAAYYVLLTYVYDRSNVVCYLNARGDMGSGKTRFGTVVGKLCYKSTFAAGSATVSPIFRLMDQFHGCLVINEFDRLDSDLTSELIKLLNNGYEKGMYILRSEGASNNNKFEVRGFESFGPKIFTSRTIKKDQAFESRCLTVDLCETGRADIPTILPGETFGEEALVIRNELLMYRFRNLNLPIRSNEELFEGVERRVRQTLLPLANIVEDEQFLAELKKYAFFRQGQAADDRNISTNGTILKEMLSLYEKTEGRVAIKDLAEKVNGAEGLGQFDKFTPQKISKIVREAFGLKTKHSGAKGNSVIVWEHDLIEMLVHKYALESSVASEVSVTGTDSTEGTEVTEANWNKEDRATEQLTLGDIDDVLGVSGVHTTEQKPE